MGIIYCATNRKNGKKYVGKTKGTLKTRKSTHYRDAKKESPRSIFHRAIKKYGTRNFSWGILCECKDDDLDKRERQFIKRLKTKKPNGYNMTDGGEGGDTLSGRRRDEATKRKIGQSQKGRNAGKTFEEIHGKTKAEKIKKKLSKSLKDREFSDEHRAKLGAASRKNWTAEKRKAWSEKMMGHKVSEESRKKMGESQRKRLLGKTLEEMYGEERAKEIREILKKRKPGFSGKKHSEETKQKLSARFKGKRLMRGAALDRKTKTNGT